MVRRIRQINLRIDEPLRRKLEAAARERRVSTNHLMNQLLKEGLEKGTLEDRVCNLEFTVKELMDRKFGNGSTNYPD